MAKFELVFNESVSKDLKDTPKQGVQQIAERTNLLRDAAILLEAWNCQAKTITEFAKEITV